MIKAYSINVLFSFCGKMSDFNVIFVIVNNAQKFISQGSNTTRNNLCI
jgi:hypothetical protein